MEQIVVGMADIKFGRGEQWITTYALGSCVGICLYDEVSGLGGMLHAMLPRSTTAMNLKSQERYVDTGIKRLFREICHRGALPERLRAKVVGGAKMFEYRTNMGGEDIGSANVMQARKELKELGIPIVCEVTGGQVGRTIHFTPGTGKIRILATDQTEQII